ncbi:MULTISPECIES: hypothetical protein [Caballeronia]|uniref:hypothetical protein n=1 Tax=Caballeronia TaxID=1827195 RepID=UPI00158B9893|nr:MULTISPECIES: hypothetical protein [Caballeronia]MCG7401983.1 hypothetical protein [Caballeronia zhejiangensis]MCI1042614.1 hypothetical protein [Caballeronia zhejiangensis]
MNKAYLIDPLARTVTLIDRGDRDSLAPAYRMLDCQYVEDYALADAGRDTLYVDEYQHRERGALICHLFPHAAFVGRALLIGATADGEEADPETPLKARCAATHFV